MEVVYVTYNFWMWQIDAKVILLLQKASFIFKQALKFSEDPRSGLLTHTHKHTHTHTHTERHRHREKEKERS